MHKQFAKWFPASVLALSLCSPAALAGFSVQGGKLVEGNGVPFVMRGVNHAHVWYKDTTPQALRDIAATGSNTVRIVLANGTGGLGGRVGGAEVAQVIQWCKDNKLIAVLEVHDATGYGDGGNAENPLNTVNYWLSSDIRSALNNQEDYVIINIANEPLGNNRAGEWTSLQTQSIQRMRQAGIKHTIMVDAPNWGQDWSNTMRNNATTVFNADSERNTVFSVHMYESYGNSSAVQSYLQDFKNKSLPVVVGEFGADHKGANVDEDAIMAVSQQLGFGYLGWSWSGNNAETKSLDIVNNFNVNSLSSWGNRLINGTNGIKQTSKVATIFGGQSSSSTSSSAVPNIAFGKPASASSFEGAGYEAAKAFDNNGATRWASSLTAGTASLSVDLGGYYDLTGLRLSWEAAYASGYNIQISSDNVNWTNLFSKTNGSGGVENISITGQGRYLRINMTTKANPAWGYSLWDIAVYGTGASSVSSSVASSISSSTSSNSPSSKPSSSSSSSLPPSSASSSSIIATSPLTCVVTQTGNWQGGYQLDVRVTNTGAAVQNWTVYLNYPQTAAITNSWNATLTGSGTNRVTATNVSYNGNLGSGASTNFGLTGNTSGALVVPSCSGQPVVTTSSSRPSSSVAPSSRSSVAPSSSSIPTTSSSVPSTSSSVAPSSRSSSSVSSVAPGVRLDNPFVGAQWYRDPVWSDKAQAEPGGSKISSYNTAVWMDRIGAIAPTDGSWGLRDHLDAALDQNANVIQVVVYDLPNRDCHALASNGELKQGAEGTARYRTEYVDALASIFSEPKYRDLRIIAIIEPDSLPNLVTNLGTPACQQAADATHGYVANTRYTLSKLYAIPNVYSYVDIGHSGWLGWSENFGKAVTLIGDAIKGATGGVNSITGFVSNTSGYTPLYEPFLDSLANSAFPGGGSQTRQAKFYEWNPHFSEVSFVQAWRSAMISAGFPSSIGMLVDTSRNGWGGTNRPTARSTSSTLDTFVDQSRIDRRAHRGNWCNQPGGVGERPQVAPLAGIDAYVWVKPPGESDGAASLALSYDPQDPAKGFDRNCDPTFTNSAGTTTGALANAPVAGRWFKEGFQVLLNNAYPPL
ncbi:MAG: glycoside hydrolase family 6 protein [Cellvibrio sp.]|uniref:glycoside hydrolase family 6 protein n=1 Tax=Cellvibrio sp. TaxID=1965322 RepID=UPI002722623E|nr:glycoside hydrolase family 6 protein [Cellvibrio sp.]